MSFQLRECPDVLGHFDLIPRFSQWTLCGLPTSHAKVILSPPGINLVYTRGSLSLTMAKLGALHLSEIVFVLPIYVNPLSRFSGYLPIAAKMTSVVALESLKSEFVKQYQEDTAVEDQLRPDQLMANRGVTQLSSLSIDSRRLGYSDENYLPSTLW